MSIEINGEIYRELRCPHCHKLICLEYVHKGRIGFNCPRCGKFSMFTFNSLEAKDTTPIDLATEFKLKSKRVKEVIK